jgi:predicted RNA-binding Zn-ribbon protein involved in translation (DUF1610 family)
MPYRLRDDFLSPAELSYFMVLRSVLGPKAAICTKVRLADLLFVARPHENMSYVNRISSKHVDFLICDASTMRPVVAIELDDASHDRNDRRLRDAFVDDALEAAGLPLVRVIPRSQYSYEEVVAQLKPILMAAPPSPAEVEPPPRQTATAPEAPICPKCGIPMVLRTAAKGSRRGSQFYGCPNFPRCREVVPFSSATSAG